MKRLDDWQLRLNDTVEAARERPFVWGKHDCCMFAASCVEAMTGENHMAHFIGTYNDEQTAKTALKNLGAGTLFRSLQKIFGKAYPPAMAQRGDIVYRRVNKMPSVGICMGLYSVFVGEINTNGATVSEGLVMVPTLKQMKIFKV